MEFILLHRPRGPLPPENAKAYLELGKKILSGGKGISYVARSESLVVCIVGVPNAENLMPVLEQMNLLGINTDVIPVDKTEVAIPKMEKALAEAAKMMKK